MRNRIGFISLGCCKNLVDAERIMTLLTSNGYVIAGNYAASDLIIINTCGFINPSIQESFDSIGEALETGKKIVITGCLGARAAFIRDHYPQSSIVGITGPHSYNAVFDLVKNALPLPRKTFLDISQVPNPGVKLTPPHYSYLKISEGCSNKCTFCAIPHLRGPMVSRQIADVMGETDRLIARGAKEIMVVAQDTLDYGRDIGFAESLYKGVNFRADFMTLLDFLSRKDAWIRLHYLYPYPVIRKIIPYLKNTSIVPYLDMPLQHASPDVLKRMRRPGNMDRLAESILAWREEIPDLCIRSTFIVGFPGETDDDFRQLLDFIGKVKMQRVGCFQYSPVHGVAANDLPDQIPDQVKEERWNIFMQEQQKISLELMRDKIGSLQDAIVDEYDEEEGLLVARTRYDSPEIDGNIFIPDTADLGAGAVGKVLKVRVTDADEYDLRGELPPDGE